MEHVILAILHDQSDNGAKQVLEMNNIDYENTKKYLQTKSTTKDGISLSEDEFPTEMDPNSGKQNGNGTRSAQDTAQTGTRQKSNTPVLDRFSTDLTLAANEGKLDPVVGKKGRNNACHGNFCVAEEEQPYSDWRTGSGESAIAEGLA